MPDQQNDEESAEPKSRVWLTMPMAIVLSVAIYSSTWMATKALPRYKFEVLTKTFPGGGRSDVVQRLDYWTGEATRLVLRDEP